jgi:hypothetical protein
MTDINLPEAYLAARLANAVYIEDKAKAAAALAGLGQSFVGQFQNDRHQAVVSRAANGDWWLSISGTRVTEGDVQDGAGDLWEDINVTPVDIGNGALVGAGAYQGLGEMWDWALELIPGDARIKGCGHSLGDWRLAYTGLFLPVARIAHLYGFEGPKPFNEKGWAVHGLPPELYTKFVFEHDVWVGYPWITRFTQRPGPTLAHIRTVGSGYALDMVSEAALPPLVNAADHSPLNAIAALAVLSEPPAQAAA